jgi:hypothetical protein
LSSRRWSRCVFRRYYLAAMTASHEVDDEGRQAAPAASRT